jgi:class 3 adenylate cyclase
LAALRANLFLPIGAVLATGAAAFLTSAAAEGRRNWLERQYLTQTFTGYVSPQVLKGILSGALAAGKAGQRRQVCVLFSDIRDFTTLSENLPAEKVVDLLNRYFDRMAHIVHQHGGLVDKFIGDGMMTLFGVPNALECPEMHAMDAAREMVAALVALNAEFLAIGLPELRIGMGLHSGEAIIGHVGSQERHEYTAIGDAVNVAARVCDLPKILGSAIVCTESVARALGFPDYLADAGTQAIKGHTGVRVFAWRGL